MTPTQEEERSPVINAMVYIAVGIVLTIAIVTALVILIVVVIVKRYKLSRNDWKRKKSNQNHDFELHGFGERRTDYSGGHDVDPNVVYDSVRDNPMAIVENENRQFPLTMEHMEQRGGRIREARRNFETQPPSLPPTSGSPVENIYNTVDGTDEDSVIDKLPVSDYEESETDSEESETDSEDYKERNYDM